MVEAAKAKRTAKAVEGCMVIRVGGRPKRSGED